MTEATNAATTHALHILSATELDLVAGLMSKSGARVHGSLRADLLAGGRSNLTFVVSDRSTRWVLRMPPRAGRTPSAHDVAREYRVTSALANTPVPVADAVLLCEDEAVLGGPFTVSGFVDGAAVSTQADLEAYDDTLLSSVVGELMATLAALHRVDPARIGLGDFGRPDGYAERQLRRWAGQWERVGPDSLSRLAAEVVDALGAALPVQRASSIVHGDYRIDNTLLTSDGGVAAVVDWELSTLGDPVADVALMCAYRDPAFDLILGTPSAWTSPRLPAAAALATAYEAAGGVTLSDWEGHLALACFKVAVLAAGIDHRWQLGGASGPGFDTAGEAIEPYLELARKGLGATL
ncbi:phosphotransferase family protein [Alloalcanivorax gelatiniphagus]